MIDPISRCLCRIALRCRRAEPAASRRTAWAAVFAAALALVASGAATAQTWKEMPGGPLQSVIPRDLPKDIWGYNDARSITSAWNSGCFDAQRRQMYVLGGGHADGAYNGVFAYDLSSQTWHRFTETSLAYPKMPNEASVSAYKDGTPAAVHTYGLVHCARGELIVASGSKWWNGGGSVLAWFLNLDTKKWRQLPFPPNLGYSGVWDDAKGRLIVRDQAFRYFAFDAVNGAVTTPWAQDRVGSYDGHTSAFDPVRRIVLTIGRGINPGGALLLEVDKRDAARSPKFSGATEVLGAEAPGLDYDERRKVFVAWKGGADTYEIDVASAIIRKVTGSGSPPPAQESNGTFNRWRYVPATGDFLLVNRIGDPVYLYLPGVQTSHGAAPATAAPTAPAPVRADPAPVVSDSARAAATAPGTGGGEASPAAPGPAAAPVAPGAPPAVPANWWFAVPMNRPGFYASSHVGGKHGRCAFSDRDQRIYCMGGDWYSYNDPAQHGNGNNEIWSYGVAANDWRKEYPPGNTPCAPAGDVVPPQPDESTWVYDSARNVFHLMPGFWFGTSSYRQSCQAATTHWGHLIYDPAARKYRRGNFATPAGGWGGDLGAKSGVFDPARDEVVRFDSGPTVQRWNVATGALTVERLPVGGAFVEQDPMAIDRQGRAVYGIDYAGHRLVRYHLDTKQAATWPMPTNYVWGCQTRALECFDGNNGLLTFDVASRVLLVPNMPNTGGQIVRLFAFQVDRESWLELPVVNPPGAVVNGNTMAYDPVSNVHMLIGGRVSPHFFLFRFAGPRGSPSRRRARARAGPIVSGRSAARPGALAAVGTPDIAAASAAGPREAVSTWVRRSPGRRLARIRCWPGAKISARAAFAAAERPSTLS
jgi:hypothetical protein